MPKVRGLTPKQSLFVKEYLVDLNAKQAAIRAGYSKKTAEWIGPQLLKKTHVSKVVKKALSKRSDKTEITAEWVIEKLKIVLTTCLDPQEGFNAAGANKALELIGRHIGMFTEKIDLKMDKPFMIVTKAASPENWPKKK